MPIRCLGLGVWAATRTLSTTTAPHRASNLSDLASQSSTSWALYLTVLRPSLT
jgi:hypothetical protein